MTQAARPSLAVKHGSKLNLSALPQLTKTPFNVSVEPRKKDLKQISVLFNTFSGTSAPKTSTRSDVFFMLMVFKKAAEMLF